RYTMVYCASTPLTFLNFSATAVIHPLSLHDALPIFARFREQTRETRMQIARQAEHRYQRKVAWGVRLGDAQEVFTTLSVPVMTRLRQPERKVRDTLVDAGVARSRSEALAWCVRLVGEHAEEWLAELREAMQAVDDLRSRGSQL